MKKIKHTIMVLSLSLSLSLQAGLPESRSFLLKDKADHASLYQRSNITFVLKQARQTPGFTFAQTNRVNQAYATGKCKKTGTQVARILNWDFKVRFRLNRNMNIIFACN